MSKGKKKRKQRREMPPLGMLDQLIYWVSGVLLLAGFSALVFWVMFHAEWQGFRDESVKAVRLRENFWAVPGLICLAFTLFGTWSTLYEGRQPIFGAPGVYYGPPLPKKYPLFWKDKAPRKPEEKAWIGCLAGFLAALNLLLLTPAVFCSQGRDEWCADGSVRRVSQTGRITEEYRAEEVRELTLGVYSHSRRRSVTVDWGVSMTLVMDDGEEYSFRSGSFRSGDREGIRRWIADLQELARLYPNVTVRRSQDLGKVIADHGLDEAEAAILEKLFQIEN